jgi:hypothetical protein
MLAEFGFDSDDLAYVRKDLFLDKLQKHFGERLKVIRHPTKGVGKILFKSSLSTDKAIVTTFDLKVNLSVKVKHTEQYKTCSEYLSYSLIFHLNR